MKHLGDITKIKGDEVPPVDVVVGGSPCQDLSIAGKRAGLAGERSGLFMEQIRIIKEMRANNEREQQARGTNDIWRHIKPRFMVWENVPGALSSNGGEDFRAVLEETARIIEPGAVIPRFPDGLASTSAGCILGDRWSIAWRVHDAQFWGVPQRRRRIALVADFGGQSAPEILFERESMRQDSKQVGTEGQGIAADTTRGAGETGEPDKMIVDNHQQAARFKICKDGISPTIYAKQGTGGNNGPMVLEKQKNDIVVIEGNGARPSHLGDGFSESDISYTLNATERHMICCSQDAPTEAAATLKQSGGIYGGRRF